MEAGLDLAAAFGQTHPGWELPCPTGPGEEGTFLGLGVGENRRARH